MSIRSLFLGLMLLLLTNIAHAQTQANVYHVDFSSLLPYVLPFYGITIVALGLFIHKLMRPNFSNKWLYACCLVGILGSGLIAYQFSHIRSTQLPAYQPTSNTEGFDEALAKQIEERETNDLKETIANYWVVAIPNFALLALGFIIDRQQKKNAPS